MMLAFSVTALVKARISNTHIFKTSKLSILASLVQHTLPNLVKSPLAKDQY